MGNQMTPAPSSATKIWGAVRPILPWALGLAIILFLAGLYAPQRLISWLSWHLYLDRLSPSFRPPLAFEGRVFLSLGAAAIALWLAILVGLLLPRPRKLRGAGAGKSAPSWAFARQNRSISDDIPIPRPQYSAFFDDPIPARNLADVHPDDAPRPPLRADLELPAGGLGPMPQAEAAEADTQQKPSDAAILLLDDLDLDVADDVKAAADPSEGAAEIHPNAQARKAPMPAPDADIVPGQEPWLQSVEPNGPAKPSAKDLSLSAMVARLEAGLSSRRRQPLTPPPPPAVPIPETAPTPTVDDHKVDVALEAALGTLKRLNMRAVG